MKKMLRIAGTGSLAIAVAVAMSGLLAVREASAAALTDKSDTMTRLEDSVASNHTIAFTMSSDGGGVAAGETITVTFPSGFDTSTITEDDVDITDDTVDLTTAANCDGSEEASVVMAADILTVTICTGDGGDIAASSDVVIEIGTNATASGTGAHQIVNDTSAGVEDIAIAGTNGDTGNIQVPIIDDDTITIAATVDESISFDVSTGDDWDIGFGDLTSANARYATSGSGSDTPQIAHSMTAGTNATGGYIITVQGATLTSGSDTIDAMAAEAVSSAGSEQFGIRMTASGGSGAVDSDYDNSPSDTYMYGATSSSTDDVAAATGASATTTYSVYYLANIAAETEAGAYSTDLTYIATAAF